MRFDGRHLLVLLTLVLSAFPDHTSANSANDPGVTPESSAIDTTKVRVGTPVLIVYGLGIADPATGEWPRLATATGTIQAINEQRLLLAQIGQDLPQRIDLQRIKRLDSLDPSDPLAEEAQGVTLYSSDDRVIGNTDEAGRIETSTPEGVNEAGLDTLGTGKRVLLKLILGTGAGLLSGIGVPFLLAGSGLADGYYAFGLGWPIGLTAGVVGSISLADPKDRLFPTLVGSAAAMVASAILFEDSYAGASLLIVPTTAAVTSELSRQEKRETRFLTKSEARGPRRHIGQW